MPRTRLAAALCLALLLAISPAHALDKQDVEYSRPDGKPLLLDLHIPDGPGPFPAAIVVHGGGFDQGNQRSYVGPVLDVLTKAGFAWFSLDYRLAPAARFPQPVQDIDTGIRWVKAHAAEYHVNPAKIALVGESAGAFLVTYAATHETPATKLAATVEFYGPTDYLRLTLLRRDHPERFDMASANRHLANGGGIAYFGLKSLDEPGALDRLKQVSPIQSVHQGMAPFLILHGTADDQVAYELSPSMCDALKKVSVGCDLITVQGGKHGMGSWEKTADPTAWKTGLVAWLQKTLRLQ
jgi:alpha-L-fucosidase 2